MHEALQHPWLLKRLLVGGGGWRGQRKNSPTQRQRPVPGVGHGNRPDKVLLPVHDGADPQGLVMAHVLVYLEDILIYSCTFQYHFIHFRGVPDLDTVCRLNPGKCHFSRDCICMGMWSPNGASSLTCGTQIRWDNSYCCSLHVWR